MSASRTTCKREGCRRWAATNDLFCSTHCAKIHHGVIPAPSKEGYNRKRRIKYLAEKLGTSVMAVENTDAMTRTVPGSFEQGKRR